MRTLYLFSSGLALGLCLASVSFGQQAAGTAERAAEPARREVQQRAAERAGQAAGQRENVRTGERDGQAIQHEGQEQQLTNYFADKLMLANQAEIEASQLAAQKSSNEEVKQFAESLIKDHQQLDEKLKQLAPEAAASFAQHGGRARDGRLAERLAGRLEENRGDRPAAEARGERPAADARGDRPTQIRTAARDMIAHEMLTKLCKINHEACQNHREMCKQMLEQYQGQDFDMAFLGMQIGQHAALLSELKAIHNVGTPEFQQLVDHTTQKVEQHLQQAKTLAKKLEDDRRAPRDS